MPEKNFDELSPTDSVREAMSRMVVCTLYFSSDLEILANTRVLAGQTNPYTPPDTKAFQDSSLVVQIRQRPDRAIEICVLKNRFGEPNGSGSVTLLLRGLK